MIIPENKVSGFNLFIQHVSTGQKKRACLEFTLDKIVYRDQVNSYNSKANTGSLSR